VNTHELEAQLAPRWARVLGLTDVPPEADFFELGGNSLLVAELTVVLEDELGIAASVEDVFAAPSIAALARRLARDPTIRHSQSPGVARPEPDR